MKTYRDIQGDGGSNVIAQVQAQQRAIGDALAGVRHRVAVASGKGGVGKSTVTIALARELRRLDKSVAILDADFNGPCQAQLAGLDTAPWIPGENGLAIPRSREGIGIASFGSLLPEATPFSFDSVATGDEQTWRATREFALLGQLLSSVDWGSLDFLLLDLPPGAERTVQFAEFLGAGTSFVLVTIPSDLSRSVVARSLSALQKTEVDVLGYVENMAGYYCRDCDAVRPLFPQSATRLAIPCLGSIPFDPAFAELADRGDSATSEARSSQEVNAIAHRIIQALEPDP